MTCYVFSHSIRAGGWVTRVYDDLDLGLHDLSDVSPDAVVVELDGLGAGGVRTIRKAFNGPLVVVGKGEAAAQAIHQGADDYAESLAEIPKILERAWRRHLCRRSALELTRKAFQLNALLGAAG
jgi:DNA-binding response OmpR family regulator